MAASWCAEVHLALLARTRVPLSYAGALLSIATARRSEEYTILAKSRRHAWLRLRRTVVRSYGSTGKGGPGPCVSGGGYRTSEGVYDQWHRERERERERERGREKEEGGRRQTLQCAHAPSYGAYVLPYTYYQKLRPEPPPFPDMIVCRSDLITLRTYVTYSNLLPGSHILCQVAQALPHSRCRQQNTQGRGQ